MTQELTERLRDACQKGREDIEPWQCNPFLFDEAAARIERLEAVLQIARMHIPLGPIHDQVCAALAGKEGT